MGSASNGMKIVYKKPSELKAADYNPRQLSEAQFTQLKKSLEGFDVVEPIVINTFKGRENIIVGGHQRVKVLESMGVDKIPCVEVSLPIEKEKELNVRLNKNTGQFDFDMLANNFEIEDLLEWGFTEDELSFSAEVVEGLTDEDAVPAAPEIPKTVLGDIWVLGNHRLMCGDSTSIDAVEKLMDGQKADMVFTDPPYNIDYKGMTDKHDKIKNDKMSDEDFLDFLQQSITPCETLYVCCSWQYAHLFKQAMENIGCKPKAMIVWDKVNPAQNLDLYYKQHEIIFYHGAFGGQKTLRGDVWEVKRQKNSVHPTMKPVELIEFALQDQAGKKIVYDGFGGSGSTMIAAEKNGRKAYLMELDPKYCDVIIQRWQEFTGKKAIHAETGEPFNGDTK